MQDDALDTVATVATVATIATANGFVERMPLFGLGPDDVFLRAFIIKATGRTRYQVYVTARYRGYGWADWLLANYATAAGPRSVRTQKIARLRISCPRTRACSRSETIGFAIDEAHLRASAADYVPGAVTPWQFKIMARNGDEHLELL